MSPDNNAETAEQARQDHLMAPVANELSPVVLVEAVEPVAIADEYYEPGERFQARYASVEQAISRGLVEVVEQGD